jgi:hypothetical protein
MTWRLLLLLLLHLLLLGAPRASAGAGQLHNMLFNTDGTRRTPGLVMHEQCANFPV